MTITTTDTVERYVGDGSQTAWPITFPFFKGEDVKACIVNSAGEQVNLVYGTDYTVAKSTSSIGGTLNYALADGVKLTIWLNVSITQPTDFYNTGPLNAEVLETSFDRLTLITQQLQEENSRAVKVATSSTQTPEQLLSTLYAGCDAAVASASAAATSESNAATSEQAAAQTAASMASSLESAVTSAVATATASATAAANAAATSEINTAASESAAAGSAITAEAWAESETPPDPNDAESKSAKTWALSAAANVPLASTTYAGKVMASASFNVDQTTGEATVPVASTALAGIVREATNEEASTGAEGSLFVTPSHLQTYGVPSGVIVMWSGATDNVPTGWALCDGENSTPDLRDRFVVGAGSTYDVGDTGGSTTVTISGSIGATTLTTAQMPSHSHTCAGNSFSYTNSSGSSEVPLTARTNSGVTGSSQSHTHSFSGTGSTNLPPYYALAYIMKL